MSDRNVNGNMRRCTRCSDPVPVEYAIWAVLVGEADPVPFCCEECRDESMRPPTGAELIATERQRQIDEEGWDDEHDDDHADDTMAIVAASLAVDSTDAYVKDPEGRGSPAKLQVFGKGWGDCWGLVAKHHGDRVRQLTIAGALIAAEIDRIQRASCD